MVIAEQCLCFCYLQPAEGRNCIADEHYLPTFFNVSNPFQLLFAFNFLDPLLSFLSIVMF
jgi:hypothetical protein